MFGLLIGITVHAVPDWYRAIIPTTGQTPTPAWDVQTAFQFMQNNSEVLPR